MSSAQPSTFSKAKSPLKKGQAPRGNGLGACESVAAARSQSLFQRTAKPPPGAPSPGCHGPAQLACPLVWIAGCSAWLAPHGGCALPPGRSASPVPTVAAAALQVAQPDVDFTNHVVLVDFQAPDQRAAFRLAGPADETAESHRCTLEPAPEAVDADDRCLVTTLSDANEQLILDLAALPQPKSNDDWREFGALVFRSRASADDVELILLISAGPTEPALWTQRLRTDTGWTAVRIDLDEIGRHLDLSHVRTLGWRLAPGAAPATLYLDDLVLADRTVVQFDGGAEPGALYALSRGSRLIVGARERFELVFRDGVLAGWFAGTPENLTTGAGLGPWPLELPLDWTSQSDAALAAVCDEHAAQPPRASGGGQTLREAARLRLVVESGPEGAAPSTAPSRVTAASGVDAPDRYVIYGDGRVFVRGPSTRERRTPDSTVPACAVLLAGRPGFQLVPASPADPYRQTPRYVHLSGRAPPADFLWITARSDALAPCRLVRDDARRRLWVVAAGESAAPASPRTYLLRVWLPDRTSAPAAERVAADYQRPVDLHPTTGRVTRDAPGDLNHDGFNEAEGCYELEPFRGALRFQFDPGDVPRESPVFRIHGSAGRRCWAHVDGQVLTPDFRDAADRLLIPLSGLIRTPRTIELHAREQ